jgi:thioredoxin-related protein
MKKNLLWAFGLLVLAGSFSAFRWQKNTVVTKGEATSFIHWYTLEEAQALSDKEPRKLFVDMYTSWCGWCKVMDANTFANPTIAKYMNEHYYCVKFDAETRDTVIFNGQQFINRGGANQRSANDFAIQALQGRLSYPSFVFIDKTRTQFTIMQGYQPADKFEPYMHYYGEGKEKEISFEDFLKTFKPELPPATAPATTAPGH